MMEITSRSTLKIILTSNQQLLILVAIMITLSLDIINYEKPKNTLANFSIDLVKKKMR